MKKLLMLGCEKLEKTYPDLSPSLQHLPSANLSGSQPARSLGMQSGPRVLRAVSWVREVQRKCLELGQVRNSCGIIQNKYLIFIPPSWRRAPVSNPGNLPGDEKIFCVLLPGAARWLQDGSWSPKPRQDPELPHQAPRLTLMTKDLVPYVCIRESPYSALNERVWRASGVVNS